MLRLSEKRLIKIGDRNLKITLILKDLIIFPAFYIAQYVYCAIFLQFHEKHFHFCRFCDIIKLEVYYILILWYAVWR